MYNKLVRKKIKKVSWLKSVFRRAPFVVFLIAGAGAVIIGLLNTININASTSADVTTWNNLNGYISLAPASFEVQNGESVDVAALVKMPPLTNTISFQIDNPEINFKGNINSGQSQKEGNVITYTKAKEAQGESIIGWLTLKPESQKTAFVEILPNSIFIDSQQNGSLIKLQNSKAVVNALSNASSGQVKGDFSIGSLVVSQEESILFIIAVVLFIASMILIIEEIVRRRIINNLNKLKTIKKNENEIGYQLSSLMVPVKLIRKAMRGWECELLYTVKNEINPKLKDSKLRLLLPSGWDFSTATFNDQQEPIKTNINSGLVVVPLGDLAYNQPVFVKIKLKSSAIAC